jgi:uncharacterized membrane protein
MMSTSIRVLEIAAVVVAGTMTGNEIAVAVFFHPQMSRLEDAVHIRAVQSLARALGAAMPVWYAVTLLLALAATIFAHAAGSRAWWFALGSTSLFALMIVYSLLLPVPINNQIARWEPHSPPNNWRELRNRWDRLHAIRVGFLVVAFVLLVASSVPALVS